MKLEDIEEGQEVLVDDKDRIVLDIVDFNITLEAIKDVSPADLEDELSPIDDEEPRNQRDGSIVFYGQFFMAVLSLILKLGPKYNEGAEPAPDEEASLENLAFIAMQLTPELFASNDLPDELTLGEILKVFIDAGVLRDPTLTFFDFAAFFHYASANNRKITIGELLEWTRTASREITPLKKKKSNLPKDRCLTEPLGKELRYTNDRINLATVRGLANHIGWENSTTPRSYKDISKDYDGVSISLSLQNDNKGPALWDILQKNGPMAIKAHYALWARYYTEAPDGLGMHEVEINISDFCRDLGYKQHHKGGFRPEAKRKAAEVLHLLTSIVLSAKYRPPGNKPAVMLTGPIWKWGMTTYYEDLFGQAREGDSELWIPGSFKYSPGDWHNMPAWRERNKHVGKFSVGLLKLDSNKDEWAILIGGYLGPLGRMSQYLSGNFYVSKILEEIGLRKKIGVRITEKRLQFERALDRLVEVGVIKSWSPVGIDTTEVDMDDPKALALYGATDPQPSKTWLQSQILIDFGFEDERERLVGKKEAAIKAKKKRATPRSKKSPPSK